MSLPNLPDMPGAFTVIAWLGKPDGRQSETFRRQFDSFRKAETCALEHLGYGDSRMMRLAVLPTEFPLELTTDNNGTIVGVYLKMESASEQPA